MAEIQDRIQALLVKTGIPAKEIKCYGSQIMIVAYSLDAANKWVSVLAKFAKVRRPVESIDYNKVNKNTVLLPSTHPVWLVGATI